MLLVSLTFMKGKKKKKRMSIADKNVVTVKHYKSE